MKEITTIIVVVFLDIWRYRGKFSFSLCITNAQAHESICVARNTEKEVSLVMVFKSVEGKRSARKRVIFAHENRPNSVWYKKKINFWHMFC